MANRPSSIMHFSPENRDTGGPRNTDTNEKTLDKNITNITIPDYSILGW